MKKTVRKAIMNLNHAAGESAYQLSPGQRRSILIVCFLLYMVNYMDRQVLSVVMEPMKQDLGLTDTQAGLLQTVFFFSMAFFAFPAAYLVDTWSRRKSLALMAVVWSIFTFVTGQGRSFLGVLLPRMLVGVGEAGFPPGGTAMISASYPESSRGRALGIFNAAIPLGAALGTILGGVIAGRLGGWKWPFFMFALPGIILGFVTLFLKDYKTIKAPDGIGRKGHFGRTVIELIKIKSLRLVYLGYAMQLAMTMAFIVWAPAFLMRAQAMGVERAGFIIGIIGLMGIVGAPLGGILADAWQKKNPKGRVYLALISVLLSAVLLFLTVLFNLSGFGLIFGLLWGVFAMSGVPAVNAVSQDVVTPGARGVAWGMAGFVAMMGGAAWAPVVVGVVSDILGGGSDGLRTALLLMVLCGLMAAFFFYLAARYYPADKERVKGFTLEAEK